MKCGLGIAGVKVAWGVIAMGQRIVRLAEQMEARAEGPYTARSNFAWRLMTLGERVEAFGELLEASVDLWAAKVDHGPPKTKRCPACNHECQLSATSCPSCGHEFPVRPPTFKPCPSCNALNPLGAKQCQNCGASFAAQFNITLEEALRTGAIVRGMDIDEDDVRDGEAMASDVREKILRSGDDKLVRLVKVLPEESWARLKNILE